MVVRLFWIVCVGWMVACSSAPSGSDGGGPEGDGGVAASVDAGADQSVSLPDLSNGCPDGMVRISAYCVDQYEAYVVEVVGGVEMPHSPFDVIGAGMTIRAKVAAGVMPQGYISQVQASAACQNAGKRLCTATEFATACRGDAATDFYPYGGVTKKPGYCNEGKGSSVARFFGSDATKWTYANFNDPRMNQWDGGLAPTGSYPHCVSPYGVADCVGNLHEWGADPADAKGHGRFRGGFYGDAEVNGHGCKYVTSAHELAYHDYSTGFRCCADASP